MQQAGTDFVMTCMQGSDNITLARAIQQYGLNVHQLWLNGYDNSLLNQYSSLMDGVYFNINGNVPFQAPKAYPGKYTGMANYLATMAEVRAQVRSYDDVAIQGWQSADLLATGIKTALNAGLPDPGQRDRPDQQDHQLHRQRADDGDELDDGPRPTQQSFPICSAFVKVQGTQFVPAVGRRPPQTIVCFNKVVNLKNPALATPQPGTPGT